MLSSRNTICDLPAVGFAAAGSVSHYGLHVYDFPVFRDLHRMSFDQHRTGQGGKWSASNTLLMLSCDGAGLCYGEE